MDNNFWGETDLFYICTPKTVVVAQLVRALDCGSKGRRFEPGHPPESFPEHVNASGFVF